MNKIWVALASSSFLLFAAPGYTQTAGMVVGAPAANGQFLPQGTSVRLRTLSPLSSMDNKVGDRFDLEVAEDVLLNGRVVIPRGSPAKGEITMVKKKGMWGKGGKLETRVLSVRANGRARDSGLRSLDLSPRDVASWDPYIFARTGGPLRCARARQVRQT